MAKFKMTILDMVQELQSFLKIPEDTLAKAKASGVSTDNSKPLRDLVRAWCAGDYDEDPETLLFELTNLLNE